jgi:hypothetical protein
VATAVANSEPVRQNGADIVGAIPILQFQHCFIYVDLTRVFADRRRGKYDLFIASISSGLSADKRLLCIR